MMSFFPHPSCTWCTIPEVERKREDPAIELNKAERYTVMVKSQ